MHILQKRQLANDIVVADLADDGMVSPLPEAAAAVGGSPSSDTRYVALSPLHNDEDDPATAPVVVAPIGVIERGRQQQQMEEGHSGATDNSTQHALPIEDLRELARLGLL